MQPGKTLAWLAEQFGKDVKIVRTMPNTPAMVGEGMTAVCPNEHLTEDEIAYVKSLLESFSRAEIVPERLMDVVTAVSGSSPAYVFMLIEAMADAKQFQAECQEKTGLSVCSTGCSWKCKDGSGYRKTSWRIKKIWFVHRQEQQLKLFVH